MVLYFLRAIDGSLYYLTPKPEYVIGRKYCDILIQNDTSISRKHAVFYIRGSDIVLNDCGSKYKTYVNGVEIQADVDVRVQKGDVIKFGALKSSYTLDSIKIVTTGSALEKKENEKLSKNIEFLKGSLVRNFQENVDYVTAKEIVMTAKVLCAIIEGKPIVNLKYWDDYVERVKHNQSIPLPDEYLPPWGEVTIKKDVSLAYNPARKTLFKDKKFVFCSSVTENKMKQIILLAGGTSMSFEKDPFTKNALSKMGDNYIIVNDTHAIDDKQLMKLFEDVVEHLKTFGKRSIPLQELAISIISCSCEKACNPYFNCVDALISDKLEVKETQEQIIMAPETNTNFGTEAVKEEVVIPATFEADNIFFSSTESTSLKQENDASKGTKRKDKQNDDLPDPKRNKTESLHLSDASKNSNKNISDKTQEKHLTQISTQISENNPFASKKSGNNANKEPSLQTRQSTDLFKNPFAALLDKTNIPSTSNNISSISSQSPFVSLKETNESRNKNKRGIEETVDISEEIINIKRPRCLLSSTVTSNCNDIEESRLDISDVDSSAAQKGKWISSRNNSNMSVSKIKTKESQEIDAEKLEFIKSFENSVVIECDESLIVKRPDISSISVDGHRSGVKNVKKFKKVQPLRPQTHIVPSADFITITC